MCIKFYLTLDHLIVDLCSSLKTMHDKQYIQLIWHIHIFTSKTFYSQHYFAEHISPASLNPASNQLWHLYVLRGKNKMLCSVYYGFISFFINYQNPSNHAWVLHCATSCLTQVYRCLSCHGSIIIVLSKHQVHMIANLNFWTCVKGIRGLLTFLLWDLCSYTPSEQEASLQVSCSS